MAMEDNLRELDYLIEKRMTKLADLDNKHKGAVARLVRKLTGILQDYSDECDTVFSDRDKIYSRELEKEVEKPEEMVEKMHTLAKIDSDALKMLSKVEEKHVDRVERTLQALPPELREELG